MRALNDDSIISSVTKSSVGETVILELYTHNIIYMHVQEV